MGADKAVLLLSCPDRAGIVAEVANFIVEVGGDIEAAEQTRLDDASFHQRVAFDLADPDVTLEQLSERFSEVASGLDASWSLHEADESSRVAIMLSRHAHCLLDLLARWRIGDLPGAPVVVISNHSDHGDIAEAAGLDFHHLPVTAETKPAQEAAVTELIERYEVDLTVMARYMQILSDDFIARHRARVINIHHSFLPAFPGAKPYHQALDRGVKIVGATAHYATADLDEGPIITQDVARISHRDSVEDVVRLGRELENRVLAAGVRAHLQHKVIVTGRRTIVFQ